MGEKNADFCVKILLQQDFLGNGDVAEVARFAPGLDKIPNWVMSDDLFLVPKGRIDTDNRSCSLVPAYYNDEVAIVVGPGAVSESTTDTDSDWDLFEQVSMEGFKVIKALHAVEDVSLGCVKCLGNVEDPVSIDVERVVMSLACKGCCILL